MMKRRRRFIVYITSMVITILVTILTIAVCLLRESSPNVDKRALVSSSYMDSRFEVSSHIVNKSHAVSCSSCVSLPKRQRHLGTTITISPMSMYGLGNQMFAYATLIGIARGANSTPVICPDDVGKLAAVFKLTIASVTASHCDAEATDAVLHEKGYAIYTPALPYVSAILSSQGVSRIVLSGFLQSYKYFSAVEADLRSEFRLPAHYVSRAANRLLHIKSQFISGIPLPGAPAAVDDEMARTVAVGVHVRCNQGEQEYGRRVAPPEYILRAMQYYIDTYSPPPRLHRVVFVVTSDNIHWCKRVLQPTGLPIYFDDNTVLQGELDDVDDLALLSACDHSIITVGTYGWWAAWLTPGRVVYYKHQVHQGTPIGVGFNPDDVFPGNWVAME